MARAKADIESDLAAVRTAINNIITGEVSQASFGDRSLQKLDLSELQKRERTLVQELNSARQSKRHSVATFSND